MLGLKPRDMNVSFQDNLPVHTARKKKALGSREATTPGVPYDAENPAPMSMGKGLQSAQPKRRVLGDISNEVGALNGGGGKASALKPVRLEKATPGRQVPLGGLSVRKAVPTPGPRFEAPERCCGRTDEEEQAMVHQWLSRGAADTPAPQRGARRRRNVVTAATHSSNVLAAQLDRVEQDDIERLLADVVFPGTNDGLFGAGGYSKDTSQEPMGAVRDDLFDDLY